MFRIGTLADWFGVGLLEGIRESQRCGAEGVQIYAAGEFDPRTVSRSTVAEVRATARACGQAVTALCGELGGFGLERPEENPEKLAYLRRTLELADALDCRVVTTHIGVVPEDNTCETYQRMKAACRELGDYAASVGVTFAIETGPEKPETLAAFIRDVGSKGIGVNLDPANLVMVTGCDPVAAVYTLKDFIVHTHAKDGVMLQQADTHKVYNFFAEGGIGDLRLDEYFKELPLGDGDVPFDKYLDALEDIGYSGFLTVERECGADPYADIKRAVDYLKSNINA